MNIQIGISAVEISIFYQTISTGRKINIQPIFRIQINTHIDLCE
jgi:hypothetical protein